MSEHLTRRGFVAGATAVAWGGLQAAGGAASQPAAKPKPLRLGLMTYNLAKDWDLETVIKNCAESKFEHVELRTTHAHGVEVTLSQEQRSAVKKRLQDSPFAAYSLASGFSYHHDDPQVLRQNIDGTKDYVLLARDIGARGFRVFPNSLMTDKGIPEEKTLEQIGRSLREVGRFAEDHGVQIWIEVHGRETDYVPRVKKMADYSQCANVRINWNCSPHDVQDPGFEANFASVKGRIGNVHLHELHDESYPYRQLFALLRQSGYEGFCDAEIAANKDPVALMKYYRALFLALQEPA